MLVKTRFIPRKRHRTEFDEQFSLFAGICVGIGCVCSGERGIWKSKSGRKIFVGGVTKKLCKFNG